MRKDTRFDAHFTPEKGWMNDPNGLICIDGVYHIFYQHYPDDTKWGPMHWGHAVSTDLTNWRHLPIALFPTEDEYIFSGSAIMDEENVSGLSPDGNRLLLLFYTMHNPKTGEQQQGLAYASEPFIEFKKYEGNPIISNTFDTPTYKKDFRDPKVFKNDVLGGYTMVLAVGDHIEFFHSDDFLSWKYTGLFEPSKYGVSGLCECPDLMIFDTDGIKKAVLSMSLILFNEDGSESHIMPYFVGDFDGKVFVPTQEYRDEVLDLGPDNYAMVSFNTDLLAGEKESAHLMMGWGENWNDARVNTNTEYFGKLTCARKAELKKEVQEALPEKERYAIYQTPVIKIKNTDNCWHKQLPDEAKEVIFDNGYVEEFLNGGRVVRSYNMR